MKKERGTYVLPVLINNAITLDFVLDSGAADVTVPADVFRTLVRTGSIKTQILLANRHTFAYIEYLFAHSDVTHLHWVSKMLDCFEF